MKRRVSSGKHVSANNLTTVSKRVYPPVWSLAAPEPKRQRSQPEPEYIDLVSDEDDPNTTGETNPDHCTLSHGGSNVAGRLRENGAATAVPASGEPIEATVDRLVAEYSRGVPRTLCGKKPKYYVVWRGRQCGMFTSWADCEAQHCRRGGPTDERVEPAALPEGPPLCQEQQDAMDLAMQGHNLFITGSGGCGKSVLVKALYKKLMAIGKSVHLLAPTGQASLNIDGRTTFSYAGWTPNSLNRPLEELIAKSRSKRVFERLLNTDVLIIDEISMVENQFFDRLSRVMSFIRDEVALSNGKKRVVGPFGTSRSLSLATFASCPR
ncbi:ATP-dependent DNA helicase PIF1 [Colletotrichum tofieldiae]|nr:ATP-dependent DNA helicase PIF1 [Colletotrichum tofieldiae]